MNVEIKSGVSNMDFNHVTNWLAGAYWSKGITFNEVVAGAKNSTMVVGAFLEDGRQVGYLRILSDKVRFGYIMDVIVDPDYRKNGIGQKMVKHALESEELKYVYVWLLTTDDAHGVYEKAGFKVIDNPQKWMIIRKERGDRKLFEGL